MPRSDSCSDHDRLAIGLTVEVSTTNAPAASPSLRPSAPKITSSTSGVSLTQVKTMSLTAATRPGDVSTTAPRSANGAARSAVRL